MLAVSPLDRREPRIESYKPFWLDQWNIGPGGSLVSFYIDGGDVEACSVEMPDGRVIDVLGDVMSFWIEVAGGRNALLNKALDRAMERGLPLHDCDDEIERWEER